MHFDEIICHNQLEEEILIFIHFLMVWEMLNQKEPINWEKYY